MRELFKDIYYVKYIGRETKDGEAVFTQVFKYKSFWDFLHQSEDDRRLLKKIHHVEYINLYPSNLDEYNKALEGEDIRE